MSTRNRFRETLWFKQGGEPAPDAPDSSDLPLEDRYLDDGSVSVLDTRSFGVHAGTTQTLAVIARPPRPEAHVHDLVVVAAELRRLGGASRLAIGLSSAAAIGLALVLAR